MTETRKSISSLELKQTLGMKRIATVWYLQQRIRIMMSGSDDRSVQLEGEIEMDDAFITAINPKQEGDEKDREPPKRGRGSQRKQPVFVMVESKKSAPEKENVEI